VTRAGVKGFSVGLLSFQQTHRSNVRLHCRISKTTP